MEKKDKIYCWNCGKVNDKSDQRCSKCGEKLEKKDHPVLTWFFGEAIDNLKGNIFDKICSLLIEFFRLHFYGSVTTLALVFAVGATVANFANKPNIETTMHEYRLQNVIEVSGCKKGYQLTGGKCVKTITLEPIEVSKSCRSGYTLKDGQCYSDTVEEKAYASITCPKTLADYQERFGDIPPGFNLPEYPGDYFSTLQTIGEHAGECMITYCLEYDSYYGGLCHNRTTMWIEPLKENLTCPVNTTEMEDDTCVRVVEATSDYSCPNGFELKNAQCIRKIENNIMN